MASPPYLRTTLALILQEHLMSGHRSPEAQPLLPERPSQVVVDQRRQIGVFSATFIIINRIIGNGIFATPAIVLGFSGSVGLAFSLWVLGALAAAAGMQVYIVWGKALPRNGGEKNYLEYLFPNPKHLITCTYAASSVLLARAAGSSLIFSEYTLKALLSQQPSPKALKLVSFACITLTVVLHGTALKWGLRLQNILGMFKLFILSSVVATGFVALRYGISDTTGSSGDRWRGLKNFENVWEGTTTNVPSICLGLYSVIWSFSGFSNANYALSEVRNPARTIQIAGPLSVVVVAALFMLANVAYVSGASKEEILNSGRLVVALLMRNVWGDRVERLIDIGVACSALGNVLVIFFVFGRVNQELGKEGVLPLSRLWASNWPYNTPLAGLSLHWLLCVFIIFFVPPGDVYVFIVNVISYPFAVVNAVISLGLIYLFYTSPSSDDRDHHWHDLSLATLLSAAFFAAANIFLVVVPLIKPPPGSEPYTSLPYWTHAAAGWGIFAIGAVGWAIGRLCGWR